MKKKLETKPVERILVRSKISGEPIVNVLIDGELLVLTFVDDRFVVSKEYITNKSVEREEIKIGMTL